MDELTALRAQQEELDALLCSHPHDQWATASRCDGWSVTDVVVHLAQTNEMAVASLSGNFDDVLAGLLDGLPPAPSLDDAVDLMVRSQSGRPAGEVHERWRRSAADQLAAFARVDPHTRVPWVAGSLSARTLATTRLSETWIHTCDIGVGFTDVPPPTDRLELIARLAWRTLPHAFAVNGLAPPGPVAFHLVGPAAQRWNFEPTDGPATTTISGSAVELCEVAARRLQPADTALVGDGPASTAVLEVVRTWA